MSTEAKHFQDPLSWIFVLPQSIPQLNKIATWVKQQLSTGSTNLISTLEKYKSLHKIGLPIDIIALIPSYMHMLYTYIAPIGFTYLKTNIFAFRCPLPIFGQIFFLITQK